MSNGDAMNENSDEKEERQPVPASASAMPSAMTWIVPPLWHVGMDPLPNIVFIEREKWLWFRDSSRGGR
jgi:hypothetical protein